MNLSGDEWKKMSSSDIMALDRTQLVNAEDIVIDTNQCVDVRIKSYLQQTGNPFAWTVGEYILQIGFQEDTDELIDDRILLLAKRRAQITI